MLTGERMKIPYLLLIFALFLSASAMAKETPPFIMAVSEDSPSSDVILMIDISNSLEARGYEIEGGSSVIYEDIDKDIFEENIVLYISDAYARIIVGEDVSGSNEFVYQLEDVLEDLDISFDKFSSDDISDDQDDEADIQANTSMNITGNASINDTDDSSDDSDDTIDDAECSRDADCDDSLACTQDSCTEGQCASSAQQGCEYNGECIAEGSVLENQYCLGNSMNNKKENKQSCTASYECSSGNCRDETCKGRGFFQAIGEWFAGLF